MSQSYHEHWSGHFLMFRSIFGRISNFSLFRPTWNSMHEGCLGKVEIVPALVGNLSELSLCVISSNESAQGERRAVIIVFIIHLCLCVTVSLASRTSLSNVTFPRAALVAPLGECVRYTGFLVARCRRHWWFVAVTCLHMGSQMSPSPIVSVNASLVASPLFCLTFQPTKRLSACTTDGLSDSPRRLLGACTSY